MLAVSRLENHQPWLRLCLKMRTGITLLLWTHIHAGLRSFHDTQHVSGGDNLNLKLNGVKHVRVAPYHAASNGLAERMVQSLKIQMKTCKGSKLSVPQRIANILLTLRSTRHPTTSSNPAKLFLGRSVGPGLLFFVQIRDRKSWIYKLNRKQHMMYTLSLDSSTLVTESW